MPAVPEYPQRNIDEAKQRILDEFNRRPDDRYYYFEKRRMDAYARARHLRAQGQYGWAKHWDTHGDSLLTFYELACKEAGKTGGKATLKSAGRLYVEPLNLNSQRMGRPLGKHRPATFQNVSFASLRGDPNKHYVKWKAEQKAIEEQRKADEEEHFAALQRMD